MTALAPTMSTQEAVRNELDESRRRGALQKIVIPPCPKLLAQLQEAMAMDEPDLNAVARIAASDVAMAAVLLRQANSPIFASGQPAQTIGQAMNRLGLEHTAAVMTGFLAQRAIRVTSVHLERFWERASKRAVAMTFMAQKLPGLSSDIAHTYGLFCHVGLPVMMQSVPGYAGTLAEARARIDRTSVETENANHNTDHAVVGALVARVWRLAPQVMAAIRLHHDLEILGGSRTDTEVQLLVAAGLLAERMMLKHEDMDPDRDWTLHAEKALTWLDLTHEELDQWDLELRDTLDAI